MTRRREAFLRHAGGTTAGRADRRGSRSRSSRDSPLRRGSAESARHRSPAPASRPTHAVGRSVIAIVKQADVPVRTHAGQEVQQCTGAFGKLEAIQRFVCDVARMPPDHVPEMQLGHLVVGHVQHRVAVRAQPLQHFLPFTVPALELQADKNLGVAVVRVAVVELGDAPLADRLAEAPETARTFRNRHREQGLAAFTDLRAFGHVAQAVEVDVRAAQHRREPGILQPLALHVFLQAGDAQRPGGLGQYPGVVEHVLDRGTDLVRIDQYHLVDELARQAERFLAHLPDRGAVREDAHLVQHHAPTLAQRLVHRGRVRRFHPDHADLGAQALDVGRHAAQQAPASDADEHRVERVRVLPQQLHRDRTLPGDHRRIVERVYEGVAVLFAQHAGVRRRVVEGIPVQHRARSEAPHRVDLDARRRHRHHDHRLDAQPRRRQRHALGVIAR
jgi:hypothetical protein